MSSAKKRRKVARIMVEMAREDDRRMFIRAHVALAEMQGLLRTAVGEGVRRVAYTSRTATDEELMEASKP